MIEPRDEAPDFTLPDQDGRPVSLSSCRGKTVILYFYPKAETPGCTEQACGVRDHRADYERADAVVLGVSPDPVAQIAAFDEKHGLGFTLLATKTTRWARTSGCGCRSRCTGVSTWGWSAAHSWSGQTA